MAKKQENLTGFKKFQAFTQSKKYKSFMGAVYGIGAAIVMVGAYFKLTHIQGADLMLALGLGVEALIFFLSAFEPQHLDYAWDNVFVELEEDWDGVQKTQFATSGAGRPAAATDMEEAMLSKMFEKMNVSEETFNKIGKGLDKLAQNAGQMADISNAMAATTNYANAMDRATKSISDFSNAYVQTNQKLSDSLGKLDFSALDANTIKKVASSMQSLNSIYELQLQGAEQTSAASKALTETMNKYMDNLNASSKNAGVLNDQLTQLSARLTALNNVYGGMLSAMNIKA
ncbi:MAG: gliding motility protein GldL [bacterium]|nr:gliding motility protein GldL [Bacteroidales bacterium]MBR6227673.1 gliding motility protein GldL [Bacteroidales bacterium]MDO5315062.1 gliding motility protein GldL [bacterium]